ncbi:MAG: hypothetical protein PHF46_02720 [Candidatus Gracilibacteria bacterium]|nr:hypothetical protein [Candidatus Gracilibacteria bacterium]MDD4530470.1 hypothetical protein [Candidatus Gracilibacteria bacterium]
MNSNNITFSSEPRLSLADNNDLSHASKILGFKNEQQVIQYLKLRLSNISENFKYPGSRANLETLIKFWGNEVNLDYNQVNNISEKLNDNSIIKIDPNYYILLRNKFTYNFGLGKMQQISPVTILPRSIPELIERTKKLWEDIKSNFY